MHHVNPFVAINMLNLFNFKRKSAKFGIWATIGAGYASYNSKFYDYLGVDISEYPNARAIYVPVGALIEYNLSKSLALGVKVQYRAHNKDNLEGLGTYYGNNGSNPKILNYGGVTNDFTGVGTVALRWKFNAINKDHVRNVSMSEYYPDITPVLAQQINDLTDELNKLKARVDKLEPDVEELKNLLADGPDDDCDGVPNYRDREPNTPPGSVVDFYGRALDCAEPRTSGVDADYVLAILGEGLDSDGDGVPDARDREVNTPPNTPVDFWGRTITSDKAQGYGSVFFDFDKTKLDAEALATIKIVAEKMKANPKLLVEVRGYADFMGNDKYNLDLSRRRAVAVKNELVKTHGVDPYKILTNGRGRILEPRKAYRMNRRCNFFFSE